MALLVETAAQKRKGAREFMRALRRMAIGCAAFYALVCLLARWVSPGLLFAPQACSYGRASANLTVIRGGDGAEYAAIYRPNPQARHLVLLFHGNAEDIGEARPRIDALWARGFAVLAVDYPGYGLSPGKPSEAGLYACADAAFHQATGPLGWAPRKVIAHGYSLGGAAAMWVASREKVGGLVLESSFMSAYRVMTGPPLVLGDRMRNLARMKSVRCPVLVIHGFDDGLVPWEHGRRLFLAAPEPKRCYWVPGAGHYNVISTAGERYWRELTDFAASLP